MSQAGIINVIDNNPNIPIEFNANTGTAVALFNVINVFGTGGIDTTASGNTITIDGSGISADITLTGDTGGPISPTLGNFNLLGAHGINTSGAGSTLTTAINNAITLGDLTPLGAGVSALTAQTGDITISGGNLNLPNTTSADVGVVEINGVRFIHVYGLSNTFVGSGAGNFTLVGAQTCTALGASSMPSIDGGFRNTAAGNGSLFSLTNGSDNVAIGTEALRDLVDSNSNVAVGSFALQSYTLGSATAVGQGALGTCITGTDCVGVGYNSLAACDSSFNTGVGWSSGQTLQSGESNTFVGHSSAFNLIDGAYNVVIGKDAGISMGSNESNNILLGSFGSFGESNTIRIGEDGSGIQEQNRAFVAGITGVTVLGSEPVAIDSNGQLNTLGFGTSGQVLTSNGAATSPTWQNSASPSGLSYAQVTLTSAQIKTLHASPITIVPAPGSGKTIIPVSVSAGKFTYGGSNVFVAAASQTIGLYYSTTDLVVGNFISNTVLVGSSTRYVNGTVGAANNVFSNFDNAPITLYNPVATEISGNAANDNSVTIGLLYFVVTL